VLADKYIRTFSIHLNGLVFISDLALCIKQGVALTGRDTTGPPYAASW